MMLALDLSHDSKGHALAPSSDAFNFEFGLIRLEYLSSPFTPLPFSAAPESCGA